VTQNYAWSSAGNENTTELSVISPLGKVIGKIGNIAPGENFQSARFIGDRLYLVTFEQIDPFFVIDISNATAPKILGELKIPGYSTYLHPYDTDRLIGLGYDTKTNQWGGVQNGGLKIDLYNVRDVKNPKQEASLIFGDAGSSSEVLSNPRAFVWYKEKNLLLLPATLMKSANDPRDTYRSQSAFQGIVGVSILPKSISEKFRVTHIALDSSLEKKWKDECARYTSTTKPTCQKLLDGSEYCGGGDSYVPPYCYAGSTVETYFASNMWNYQRDFITRALYVGETFYSLSESGIKSWNFSNTTTPKASLSFPASTKSRVIYPVPMMAR
jgi:Beta propeller domain